MVAGQKKKRLNGSCVESVDLLEQRHTKKKKKMGSLNNLLNMRAHVSVEWDDNQQMVVAKRDQIGIAWRELGPFIPLSPHSKDLADVFSVPQELFALKDVTDVLSCEVWEAQLSEVERSLLTKFLPEESDAKQVVQTLLTGENFHFGNPFLKWGASVCSGDFHPDAILSREQCLKEKKKAYYFELHKYHNDMLENLQNWKEIWESCEDPERDMVEKIRSFSRTCRNGSRPYEPEENLLATTKSCSPVAREKMQNRKQSTFTSKSGELQDRNGLDRCRILSTASEGTRLAKSSRKEEKPQKLCISGDGAKYMSYVMITKKQLELVKGMRISGSGVKSTSLSHVLGDIKSFKIQPYVALEEEERKNLHKHWLQLANRDLPSAFANWKERQLLRQQWRTTLVQELAGKKDALVVEDEGNGNLIYSPEENRNEGKTYEEAPMDIQNCESDKDSPHSTSSGTLQRSPSGSSLNCNQDLDSMDKELEVSSPEIYERESASQALSKITEERKSTEVAVEHKVLIHSPEGPLLHQRNNLALHRIPSLNHQHDDNALDVTLTEVVEQKVLIDSSKGPLLHHMNNLPLQQIPSLNHQHEDNAMDVQLVESSQDILKLESNGALPILSDFVGSMSSMADAVQREVPGPTAKDTWSDVVEPDPYYHSTPATHGYASSSELSLRRPNIFGVQPNCWIDLQTDLLNQDAKGTSLHRSSNTMGPGFNVDSGIAPFSSYTNQDCNEHLQSFLSVRGLVSSHANDQKQVGLQFLGSSNGLQETELHPGHLQEQHLLMQRQQMRERELYMHQAAHKNMNYGGSGSGRYSLPPQEYFSSVNMQNWNVDADHLSAPFQVQSSGRESFSQNTFPLEHQTSGVWSGMDISSSSGECMGNGSNADGSLYSALPQFHNLQPHSSYSSIGSQQQNVSPRNFVSGSIPSNDVVPPRNFVTGGIPSNGDIYQHTGHRHSYLGHEDTAPASVRTNNTSWMNLQHQSSGLHDSIGKQLEVMESIGVYWTSR